MKIESHKPNNANINLASGGTGQNNTFEHNSTLGQNSAMNFTNSTNAFNPDGTLNKSKLNKSLSKDNNK